MTTVLRSLRGVTFAAFTLAVPCLAYVACDSGGAVKETLDSGNPGTTTLPDGAVVPRADSGGIVLPDAGTLPDGAVKDCYDNPQTHFEIINGCTTATKLTVNPVLSKLLPDGGLPPLP